MDLGEACLADPDGLCLFYEVGRAAAEAVEAGFCGHFGVNTKLLGVGVGHGLAGGGFGLLSPEGSGGGVDAVAGCLGDVLVAELDGCDACEVFGGGEGDAAFVDVSEESFRVFGQVKSIEDPVDGAAYGVGDGVDAIGGGLKEFGELHHFFDGGEVFSGGVLGEFYFAGAVVGCLDDGCRDGVAAEEFERGEAPAACNDSEVGAGGSDGDGI